MAELTLTTFLPLDGVMQAPGGPGEDESGGFPHGGWVVPHADAERGRTMVELFGQADAFLPGRGAYDIYLVRSSTTSTGVVVSVYRPAGSLQTGSFSLD